MSDRTQNLDVQAGIEKAMKSFGEEFRWESIHLFSSEGYPMAACGSSALYSEDTLLEFSFSLAGAAQFLGEPDMEIVVRGTASRRLVFRFFTLWDEPVILAATVHGSRGYRRAMDRLIHYIQTLH